MKTKNIICILIFLFFAPSFGNTNHCAEPLTEKLEAVKETGQIQPLCQNDFYIEYMGEFLNLRISAI